MYLDFFHLTKEPFHVTPDPEFLFLSESHKQALAAIVYGVKTRKGLITITGPVGSGKTTVLRAFPEEFRSGALQGDLYLRPRSSLFCPD